MVEMLLLVLIAAAVFAFVLAPLVRPERPDLATDDNVEPVAEEQREPVASDGHAVRDTP